jgi:hypothetical protein
MTQAGDELRLTPRGRHERDGIEAETDRVALAPWPTGEDADLLGQDLDLLIVSLPEPTEPIVHH